MARTLLFLGFIVVALISTGCLSSTVYKYVCTDGRILDAPQGCLNLSSGSGQGGTGASGGSLVPEPTLPGGGLPSITPPSSADLGVLERDVLDGINLVRVQNGLDQLKWSERAASADRKYAQYLVESGNFAHSADGGQTVHDRLDGEGLTYFLANENLAQVSFSGALPSAKEVVDGWMQSPGHRSNLIDVDKLYSHAGVGVYCGKGVCVFAYSAVSLRRTSAYALEPNFYSFVYVNDPGFGFAKTVPVSITLSNVSGKLDAFVLPNSTVFDEAKALPASDFAARKFPYVRSFENSRGFSVDLNASVGTGVMVINTATQTSKFVLTVELTG
ncbi:CAP domain-containing protein [Candidatus Micrarchaeota archaeon]|nr:CAP domain-containing protein [Candidatus Micrarchaeota archaeon]